MTTSVLRCHPCAMEPPERGEEDNEHLGRPIVRLVRQEQRRREGLTVVNGTLTCLHHAREQEAERLSKAESDQRAAEAARDAMRPTRRPRIIELPEVAR